MLIPASLVWVMIVAAFRQLTNQGYSRIQTLAYVGIPLALVVLIWSFLTENRSVEQEIESVLAPTPGSYPLPVLTAPPVHETTAESSGVEVSGRD